VTITFSNGETLTVTPDQELPRTGWTTPLFAPLLLALVVGFRLAGAGRRRGRPRRVHLTT
jgi:hypothetical protein